MDAPPKARRGTTEMGDMHTKKTGTGLLLLLTLALTLEVKAQECTLHRECGPGLLCGEGGTCNPVLDVLDTGSDKVYWVNKNHPSASDANAGVDPDRPKKTIGSVTGKSFLKPGDVVLVRSGTYREPIEPQEGGATGKRITFAAYPGDEVVVTGAIPVDREATWTRSGGVWTRPWSYDPGFYTQDAVDKPVRQRDVLIANGRMLQAVYERGDVVEGTFYVEGAPRNPTRIYARLPGDKNPNTAAMETSVADALFFPAGSAGNCGNGQQEGHYRLIGFTFRHVANYSPVTGAVCSGGRGSLIEDVTVEWANAGGLKVAGPEHVVRGVRAYDNGQSGIDVSSCDGCLIEHSESKRNNWKGYNPNNHGGGGKVTRTKNSVFRHLVYADNEGIGFWFDHRNQGNVLEKSRFDNNLYMGIMIELESDGTVVRNNVVTRTRTLLKGGLGNYGITLSGSSGNLIAHNTIMGNEVGFYLRGDSRNRSLNNHLYNNLFVDNGSPELTREVSLVLKEPTDEDNIRLDGNAYWYRPPGTSTFDQATFYIKEGNGFANNDYTNVLTQWQALTGFDGASMVMDPSRPHVVNPNDSKAGWRLAKGSQFIGQGVALPAPFDPVAEDIDGNPRPATGADAGAHQRSAEAGAAGEEASAVLYRVNAGGDELPASRSGEPAWSQDRGGRNASAYVNDADIGSRFFRATNPGSKDATVPAGTPVELFQRERWDPDDGAEMQWDFPVPAGKDIEVRLYFAEILFNKPRKRTFDVAIEGEVVLEAFDVFAEVGRDVGTMRAFTVQASDGNLDIDFLHGTRNHPAIKGIEIIGPPDGSQARQQALEGAPAAQASPLRELHSYELLQNRPNPFHGVTRIPYELGERGHVRIAVYDLLGRLMTVLVDGHREAGRHHVSFDGAGLTGGVYLYELRAGGRQETRRMIYVK